MGVRKSSCRTRSINWFQTLGMHRRLPASEVEETETLPASAKHISDISIAINNADKAGVKGDEEECTLEEVVAVEEILRTASADLLDG